MFRKLAGIVAVLALAGCAGAAAEETASSGEKPAKVEKNGSGPAKVTLTERAAKRLDIQTIAVREDKGQKVIPYSAVLYDPQGQAWTFTSPAALTFVREQLTVRSIAGDSAILTAGPAAGTTVVTVGAAELYGAELGVGK